MRQRAVLLTLLFAPALAPSGAQRGPVTVHGVVFDSLRGRPLHAAFVTISGQATASETDSAGRFRFDSVAPGVYTITAQHPLFDSIGISGLTVRAAVRTGAREIALAVPSFETLWRLTCPGRAPKDSGIVFGTIRHSNNGATVANAALELSWVDLLIDDGKRVVERHWKVDTRTNERGGYAVCGVPLRIGLAVRAHDDSSASGAIDLAPDGLRIVRRDLIMGPVSRGARRGSIAGTVTDSGGAPIAGARVRLGADTREVRTGADGGFMLRDVPAGTRQIEVLAVGVAPALAIADVTPGDTAMVSVRLQKLLTLDAVRTMAARGNRVFATEFDARRRLGLGYARDSSDIAKYTQFINVLRDIPSLSVRYGSSALTITTPDGRGSSCAPDVLIDGVPAAFGHLIDLQPNEVGGLEVYARAAQIPGRFVPPGIRPSCGMILVWTLYGFRNR